MSLAVILAAGKGSRLGDAAKGLPKPLVKVGEYSLIHRQIKNLQAAGVDQFLVVCGHRADELMDHVREIAPDAKFVYNADYATTNTLQSLHCAMPSIGPMDFYYLNADVLFGSSLIAMLNAPGNQLAVEVKPCAEEEVKVIVNNQNHIRSISKKLKPEQCLGEFIGIAKFGSEFYNDFAEVLASEVELGHGNDYFEAALHILCKEHLLHAVDITGEPVIEIDFPADLERAKEIVAQIDR